MTKMTAMPIIYIRPCVDIDIFNGKVKNGYISMRKSGKIVETLDFPESFVACDLKLSRYIQC